MHLSMLFTTKREWAHFLAALVTQIHDLVNSLIRDDRSSTTVPLELDSSLSSQSLL